MSVFEEKLDYIIERIERMEVTSENRFRRMEEKVDKVVMHDVDITWMKRLSGYAAGLATTLAFWVLGKSFPH